MLKELNDRGIILKAILYVHGKGGSHTEKNLFENVQSDYEVIGLDYNEYLPWDVKSLIENAYKDLAEKYESVSIIANSIGAYFAMLALQHYNVERAFFISPVLDMEALIMTMMSWAGVTQIELREKGKIETSFGETLSWKYLEYVRANRIIWNIPTEILYAECDNLISRKTVDDFVLSHNATLTIMKGGEHWFHTEDQITFMKEFYHNWLSRK